METIPVDLEVLFKRHHLLRPDDVDRICSQVSRPSGLVAGIIGHRSVSVLIGDSGLGKSPLAYQLGLCVAEGIPFLGLKTERGTVIYADYENGLQDGQELRKRLVGFLKLPKAPDGFVLWSPDLEGTGSARIEDICHDIKPALLIIDSLRSHDPSFEKSDVAGERMNALRSVAYKHNAAILAIHHVRKPGLDGPPSLDSEDSVLMQWLNQASGHRSIISQSDSRLAAGLPGRGRGGEMVLRWHRRIHGEGGPIYLERVCDEEGTPVGYIPAVGAKLLENPEQQAAFERLPEQFSFKEAKQVYARTDDPTRKWLVRCEHVGIVKHIERGLYRKFVSPDELQAQADRVDREAA
jgi:hypothetical protein